VVVLGAGTAVIVRRSDGDGRATASGAAPVPVATVPPATTVPTTTTTTYPGCIESTPAVWKGRIYVGTRGGYMYALSDP